MDGNPVDKWSWLAANPKGLKRTRRRAALKLAETGTPLAAMGLARAAANSGDEEVAALALRTFSGATDQEVIDVICGVWKHHRDSVLSALIMEERWVASQPLDLHMLTALQTERLDALADGGAELARMLLTAAREEQQPLNERARKALSGLTGRKALDAVCEIAIRDGDPIALAIATANDFAHDPSRQALLLFLAGEFERLAELDFDGRLLARVHASADDSLRARLAAQARASSRVEWVRAIAGARRADQLEDLSDEEWALMLDVLAAAGHRTELWHLVFRAPPVWGARLLGDLASDQQSDKRGIPSAADELAALAGRCRIFDPDDAHTRLTLKRRGRPTGSTLAVSPDGTLVASGDEEGGVELWRVPSGERITRLEGHQDAVTALAIAPDGSLMASGGFDGFLQLWRLPDGAPIGKRGSGHSPLVDMAFSADGSLLAYGTANGAVNLDLLPSGDRVGVGRFESGSIVSHVAFSRDGRFLAARSVHGTVITWRLTAGVLADAARVLQGVAVNPDAGTSALAVAPDGTHLATGGYEGRVQLWELPSGARVRDLSKHVGAVSALTYSPDGRVVSGDLEGWVSVSSASSGSRTDEAFVHPGGVSALAVSSDGRLLASGGADGRVSLRHLPSMQEIGTVSRHQGEVTALAMTPDGRIVVSSGTDGTIRVATSSAPELARRSLGRIDFAEVERLRAEHSGAPGVLAWYDLILALLHHRHRYDIDVTDASPEPMDGTDIELDFDGGRE